MTRGGVSRIGKTVDGLDALAWVPGIGGSVTGFSPTKVKVKCKNETTGQMVNFNLLPDLTAWNCEAQGLEVKPGDEIEMEMEAVGKAD